MWIDVFLAILGFSAGSAVSCGVFAILVKLGVFTRIVEFLREAKNIRLLESFIVFGGIAGNLITVFTFDLPFGICWTYNSRTFLGNVYWVAEYGSCRDFEYVLCSV